MNILESILNAQDGGAVRQIGAQLGLGNDQTSAALAALVPALAAGFQRNAQQSSGLDSLVGALTRGSHARYVDDPATLGQPDTIADGNGILGHIFGSRDVSRQVAARAAAQTGIGEDVLKKMLPIVAAMMMGTMSRRMTGAGAGAGIGAGAGLPAGLGGDLVSMLASTLDRDRDGSVVDDVIGMIGRVLR
jgi:hypothetical protein